MRVECTLTMRGVEFRGRTIDEVCINWFQDFDDDALVRVSAEWIQTEKYLTKKIPGLLAVREADLELCPCS